MSEAEMIGEEQQEVSDDDGSGKEEAVSSSTSSVSSGHGQEEAELKWAAIERLPTWDRLHTSLPLHANAIHPLEPVDVRRLGAADRRELVHTLIADIHEDNLRLLRHQHHMMDMVGTQQPTTKVPWRNLRIEVHYRMTLLLALAGNLDKMGY